MVFRDEAAVSAACALAGAALAAALALPTGAHAQPLQPLASRHLTAPGWVAWRLEAGAGGGSVSLRLQVSAPGAASAAVGAWFLGADGTEFAYANVRTGGDQRVHLAGPAGPGVDVRSGGNANTNGFGVGAPLAAGSSVLVGMAAQEGAAQMEADMTLAAEGPVTLAGETAGTQAFVHREQDFDGTLNASAAYDNVTLKAILGGAREIPASGRMFAIFGALPGNQVIRMGFDGPAGSRDGATFYSIVGGPSGRYRFRIDQALGGPVVSPLLIRGGMILLVGADVTVP